MVPWESLMRALWCSLALTLTCVSGERARACTADAPLNLIDIGYADVVVIGRVSDYHIVRDEEFRREMLSSRELSREMQQFYEGPDLLLPDYARFNIQVDEVLAGQAPATLSVTWDNSTFEEPLTMATGPFLIALRRPNSGTPPLRGPSATVLSSPDPSALTVLQAPCSTPFIFESDSEAARTIRQSLSSQAR
jgi:hypothetical protein